MNILMVANDNGKMPKSYLKKLRTVTKQSWEYEENAQCFIAVVEDIEEAKLIAMKIVASLTPELPSCYCAYMIDRVTRFYHDKLGYREVSH